MKLNKGEYEVNGRILSSDVVKSHLEDFEKVKAFLEEIFDIVADVEGKVPEEVLKKLEIVMEEIN